MKQVASVIKGDQSVANDSYSDDSESCDAVTLDLTQARMNLGYDDSLLREIATVFIEDVPLIAAELEEALQSSDTSTVCRLAHSLKGLCATFGAEPARTYAQRVEIEAASEGTMAINHPRIQALLHALESTVDTLRNEMRHVG